MKLKQSHKILKFIWNYATIFFTLVSLEIKIYPSNLALRHLNYSKLNYSKLIVTFPFLLPFVAVHVSRLSYTIAIRRAI